MVEKHYKDKPALVAELHEKLQSASSVVITEYRGLKAGDLLKLRTALRGADVEVKVVKNSLLRRAAAGTPSEALVGEVNGPIAVALGYGEPTEAAKLLTKGAKDFEKFIHAVYQKRAKQRAPSLSNEEAALLEKIYDKLPVGILKRFEQLKSKFSSNVIQLRIRSKSVVAIRIIRK